jgi:hypothetical protein
MSTRSCSYSKNSYPYVGREYSAESQLRMYLVPQYCSIALDYSGLQFQSEWQSEYIDIENECTGMLNVDHPILIDIRYLNYDLLIRNDHTTMTAPLPVCSAKLSIVGPG